MKAKTKRNAIRWLHILTGSLIATHLYSPWDDIPAFDLTVKYLVLPVLILPGLWLWKEHLLRKQFTRKQSRVHSVLGILLVSAGSLAAQSVFRGGSGSFDVGIQTVDVGALNDRITQAGYPGFSNVFYTIGGSGEAYLGRMVLGGEGAFYGQADQVNANFETEPAGGHGMLSVGYIALSRKGWLLFPSLGLGVSDTGFNLHTREKEYSFGDVLQQPADFPNQSVEFGQTSGLLRVAVQVEKFFQKAEEKYFGPKVGLTLGYTFATQSSFRQEGIVLEGSPSFSPSGFFAKRFFCQLENRGRIFGEDDKIALKPTPYTHAPPGYFYIGGDQKTN